MGQGFAQGLDQVFSERTHCLSFFPWLLIASTRAATARRSAALRLSDFDREARRSAGFRRSRSRGHHLACRGPRLRIGSGLLPSPVSATIVTQWGQPLQSLKTGGYQPAPKVLPAALHHLRRPAALRPAEARQRGSRRRRDRAARLPSSNGSGSDGRDWRSCFGSIPPLPARRSWGVDHSRRARRPGRRRAASECAHHAGPQVEPTHLLDGVNLERTRKRRREPPRRGFVNEELVKPVARFKMLHQYPHRNPRAAEHGSSAQNVWVPVDQLVRHDCPRPGPLTNRRYRASNALLPPSITRQTSSRTSGSCNDPVPFTTTTH